MSESAAMRDEVVVCGSFYGATIGELRKNTRLRRIFGIVSQKVLFPHRGQIELSLDQLRVGSWRTLVASDVVDVSMDFLPDYSRLVAGGARGGFPSFGIIKQLGAPLILDLRSGERILVLIDYTWWSGTTQNANWLPALRTFAEKGN